MKKLQKYREKPTLGIALFIILMSVALISFVMRDLIQASSSQAYRVRNYADRIQSIYLARSALALSRFILMVDRVMDSQSGDNASDTPSDLWSTPVNFPLTAEEVMMIQSMGADGKPVEDAEKKGGLDDKAKAELGKKCAEFFEDFPGTASSVTSDLSGLLYLNDISSQRQKLTYETLIELLKPNVEFLQHLNSKNVTPESLAREIRDYSDADNVENETTSPEDYPYTSQNLEYTPKNRVYMVLDELKLVPHVDDIIFDYLSDKVIAYFIPQRADAKINLNTTTKLVFQSLLKNVPNAEELSEEFIRDRKENKRNYTEKNAVETVNSALRLSNENIRANLVTGVSDLFKIETTAVVNNIQTKLETIVSRPKGIKKVEPIILMRVSP